MPVLSTGISVREPAASGELPSPSRGRRVLEFLRRPRPPVLVAELALIALGFWLYSLIRNAVPEAEVAAISRAFDLWAMERDFNIDVELWVNQASNAVEWLIIGMNYFYAIMHFIVTAAVLAWLYWQHPGRYRPARTVLAMTSGLALIGYFVYPLAPPRLLPDAGFIDTVRVHETWGSLASGDLQNLSNQYAAMPSMHAGWSLWCGIALVMFARNRWLRTLGVLYPVITLVVIVATANHFVLDAAGGYLTLGAGFALQWLVHGRPVHAFSREVPALT